MVILIVVLPMSNMYVNMFVRIACGCGTEFSLHLFLPFITGIVKQWSSVWLCFRGEIHLEVLSYHLDLSLFCHMKISLNCLIANRNALLNVRF